MNPSSNVNHRSHKMHTQNMQDNHQLYIQFIQHIQHSEQSNIIHIYICNGKYMHVKAHIVCERSVTT